MNVAEQQQLMFGTIRKKFKSSSAFLDHLSGVLFLGRSTLYKKIKGETMLNFEELQRIGSEYEVSIDSYISGKSTMQHLDFPSIAGQPSCFEDFVDPIIVELELMKNCEGASIHYATNELPLYYYLLFEELALFKLFVWGKTVWKFSKDAPGKYSHSLGTMDLKTKLRKGYDLYAQIDSREFWSLNILDNTLHQIRYFAEGYLFQRPEDAMGLHEQIFQLIDVLEEVAEEGCKYRKSGESGAILDLYHNEILHTNNLILSQRDGEHSVRLTIDNPNFMLTKDPKLGEYVVGWFDKLKQTSMRISTESRKERALYFRALRKKVEESVLLLSKRM